MPALEAIIDYDFLHRLGEIGCPTLVVQGTEDLLVPLGDAYEFERRIPKATTLILEDTGHVPSSSARRRSTARCSSSSARTSHRTSRAASESPTLAQERV